MTPGELFHSGKLTQALEAAKDDVKKHPADTSRRGLYCELLCFAGQFERADQQLETLGQQDPSSMVGIIQFRQLLRGEMARQEFAAEGRPPELVCEASEVLQDCLLASIAVREGRSADALQLLEKAESNRVHMSGKCNGEPFDDWRDLDDLTSPVLEVLSTDGKYRWVPVDRIERLEFRPPERPRDLLWRKAHLEAEGGVNSEIHIPVLYAGTHKSQDDQLRLGRGTEWSGGEDSPVRGIGQRMFLIGSETQPIMTLNSVELHQDQEGTASDHG